jgi:microcystin-dependent protein
MVDSVLKNDDRNFSYYSLKNAVEIDREPSNGDWDLWFTNGLTANVVVGPPGTPLGTASGAVYINRGIQSIRISGVPNDSADYMTATFDSTIYKIGDTYRIRVSNPPPGGWVVVDSNVYFIKAKDTEIYKLVFTSYEGQGTGKVTFEKTQLTNNATSVNDITSNATRIALYPNPAVDQLNLILDATEAGMHNIIVTDLAGKVAYNTTVAVNGLQNISIPVSNFANGLYLVSVEANGNRSVQKFVKQ